jgi:hypothetical protein
MPMPYAPATGLHLACFHRPDASLVMPAHAFVMVNPRVPEEPDAAITFLQRRTIFYSQV